MNNFYRSIWNPSLGAWVATAETVSARGKRSSSHRVAVAAALLTSALGASAGCIDFPSLSNWAVGATNGSTCHAQYDLYSSANTAYTDSGGVLIFDKPAVTIDAYNGGSIYGLGINRGGTNSQSAIHAQDLTVRTNGRGATRSIFVGGQGTLDVSGTLTASRWGYAHQAATIELSNGNLIVGKDLHVLSRLDDSNGSHSSLRISGNSSLSVGGTWYVSAAQYYGDDPAYQPGGISYNGNLGAGTPGIKTTDNFQLTANRLDLRTQQNRSNGWNHVANGNASRMQVTNEALLTTYGQGSTNLNIAVQSLAANEQSVMSLGAGTAPTAQAGTFQLQIGDKARFQVLGENSQALALSTSQTSSANAHLQIDAGASFDLQQSGSTGIALLHAGSGELALSNAAHISATTSAISLSTSGQGDSVIHNSGTLSSSSATQGALNINDTAATPVASRRIDIDNSGTISAARSAILVTAGEATTEIHLSNSGQIQKTAVDGHAVIDFGNTQGSNHFAMSAGLVGSPTSSSTAYLGGSGSDHITQTGGRFQGDISTMAGNDSFTGTAGSLAGSLFMGDGNDSALFSSAYDMSQIPRLDGGSGVNALTLQGQSLNLYSAPTDTVAQGVNLQNWQTINLQNTTHAMLTGDLQLGGRTGLLTIDATSSAALSGTTSTARTIAGSVNNAGTLDLRNPAPNAFNTLTIQGDYTGNDGKLLVNTALGNSQSPSDQLIVDRGAITGNTQITVTNKSGLGAETSGNGILVVSATNGSTSSTDAFSLSGGTVSAGAYTYRLERNANASWYLSSTANPGPGSRELPGPPPQPEYSPQTSVITAAPSLALLHGAATLDSWQERMGARVYGYGLKGDTTTDTQPGWVRLIGQSGSRDGGQHYRTNAAGSLGLSPGFNYDTYMVQMGMDFYRQQSGNTRQAAGAYLALGQTKGEVNHWSFANKQWTGAGNARADGTTLGLYWSRIAEQGQYLDAVLQYTDYRIKTDAHGASGTKTKGQGFAASLEGGVPYALNAAWTLTPQAQLRWQHISLDDIKAVEDGTEIGRYHMGSANSLWGRLSLQATYQTEPKSKAWVRADLMREFRGDTEARYTATQGGASPLFKSSLKGTAVGLTAGVDHQVDKKLALYASASYARTVTGNKGDAWAVKAGLRWNW